MPQPKGTYAGEDVEFGEKEPDQPDGWEYAGSGFHYLTRVERDRNPRAPSASTGKSGIPGEFSRRKRTSISA